jgi:hypothetical protein
MSPAAGSASKGEHSILAQLSDLRILVGRDRVELSLPKADKLGFKVTEMLLGPLNLYANQDDSVVRV